MLRAVAPRPWTRTTATDASSRGVPAVTSGWSWCGPFTSVRLHCPGVEVGQLRFDHLAVPLQPRRPFEARPQLRDGLVAGARTATWWTVPTPSRPRSLSDRPSTSVEQSTFRWGSLAMAVTWCIPLVSVLVDGSFTSTEGARRIYRKCKAKTHGFSRGMKPTTGNRTTLQ